MKCNCVNCGKELDSEWCVTRNYGRHKEYWCDKCANKGVKDSNSHTIARYIMINRHSNKYKGVGHE